MRTFLKGRGKLVYLTGPAPKVTDPNFATRDVKDSMLMSQTDMECNASEISKNYMFLSIVRDIWETVKRTYYKVQDALVVCEIKTKTSSTKQGSLIVTKYYNRMNGLWLELNDY